MKRTRVADGLYALTALVVFLAQPAESVAADPRSIGSVLWTFAAVYAPPLLAYIVVRTLTVHLVLRSMMKRAPGPVAAESPADTLPAAQPAASLRFLELDAAKGVLLGEAYEDRVERALDTGARTLAIFWRSLLAFTVPFGAVLYQYFAWGASTTGDALEPPGAGTSSPDLATALWTGGGVLLCLALGFGVLIAVVTVTTRYRSLRRVSLWSCTSCVILLTALSIAAGRTLGAPWYVFMIPPICAALVVVAGYARIGRAARADGRLTLLILRVFGADANTAFVFGPLMRSWRFLGTFFTIVDPSYIRYQFSLSSAETRWKLLRLLTAICALVAVIAWVQYGVFRMLPLTTPALAAWGELDQQQQQRLLSMMVWLLLIPMSIVPVVWAVRSRFVRSGDELERRIAHGMNRPAGLSGTFSGQPLYCHDNVWKTAVQALLNAVDVVLMDLRGFSPARRGCEYEIGLLLNRYPIQQMVFLVDRGVNRDAVYDTIRRVWSNLASESPNRGLASPTVKVYAPIGDAERDAPRILSLLVASAMTAEDSDTVLVQFDSQNTRRRVQVERHRRWGWPAQVLHLGEGVDSALATPKYARVLIPVILAAVALMFYMSLRPALSAYGKYRVVVTTASATPLSAETSRDASDAVLMSPPSVSAAPTDLAPGTATGPTQTATLDASAKAAIRDVGGLVGDRTYSKPVAVHIELTGPLAAKALRYGQVTLEPASTDAGDPLELLQVEGAFASDMQHEFGPVDRAERDFWARAPMHPDGGVGLTITYFRPEKPFAQVKRLAGHVTIQTFDPDQTVTLDNVGARASEGGTIKLEDPRLDGVGQFSLTFHDAEHPTLQVRELQSADIEARLVDAAGRIVSAEGGGGMTFNGVMMRDFVFTMSPKSLKTARLEILVGYKSFTVPFSLTDIPVSR